MALWCTGSCSDSDRVNYSTVADLKDPLIAKVNDVNSITVARFCAFSLTFTSVILEQFFMLNCVKLKLGYLGVKVNLKVIMNSFP